jgi:hypothetical protein
MSNDIIKVVYGIRDDAEVPLLDSSQSLMFRRKIHARSFQYDNNYVGDYILYWDSEYERCVWHYTCFYNLFMLPGSLFTPILFVFVII